MAKTSLHEPGNGPQRSWCEIIAAASKTLLAFAALAILIEGTAIFEVLHQSHLSEPGALAVIEILTGASLYIFTILALLAWTYPRKMLGGATQLAKATAGAPVTKDVVEVDVEETLSLPVAPPCDINQTIVARPNRGPKTRQK